MSWKFELATAQHPGALVGIAPHEDGVLYSEVMDSRIWRLAGDGTKSEWRRFTARTSGLAEGPHGIVYGCQEMSRRVAEFMPDGTARVTATTIAGAYHNHPSDAVVDSAGRVWFCDPHNPMPAFGPQFFPALAYAAVMRLTRGPNHRWTMQRLTHDTVHPRALALSPDEKTLYVAEGDTSPDSARELRAYPVNADGSLGRHEVLMTFGRDHKGEHRGIEGLCVDSEGFIVACGGSRAAGPGARIYVFDPRGAVVESHELPDDLPMRCAFAGAARDELYVTTGTGRVWRARGGRTGLRRFAH